ncbi:MAG: hypothetical protein ABI411_21545 [Tahibacter sp.]
MLHASQGFTPMPAVLPKSLTSLSTLPALSRARIDRMQRELRDALALLPPAELKAWGQRASRLLRDASLRRAHDLWRFGGGVWRWSRAEVGALTQETRAGRGVAHLQSRLRALREGTTRVAIGARDWLQLTLRELTHNPREAAPRLASAVLAHLLGRGGPRSEQAMTGVDVATNLASPKGLAGNILVGAAFEAGLEAMIDLSRLLARYLPAERDPLWDRLIAGRGWVEQLLQGDDAQPPPPPLPLPGGPERNR